MWKKSAGTSASAQSKGSDGPILSIDQGILATIAPSDEDYAQVYGIRISAGKFFFDDEEIYRSNCLVINETAQKALLAQVGDKVKIQDEDEEFTIVGIVKDFNYESLHEPVEAVAFVHTRDFGAFRYFSFKLSSEDIGGSVQEIESIWKSVFPNEPFVYGFIDERLAHLYQTEFQLKKASVIWFCTHFDCRSNWGTGLGVSECCEAK